MARPRSSASSPRAGDGAIGFSRRGLLGAGALVLAACSTGPPATSSSAADPSKPGPPIQAQTFTGTMQSKHWPGGSPAWRLALPPAPGGLVVGLHGKGGSAEDSWNLGLHEAALSVGLAYASVDGGNYYWHERSSGIDTGAMVLEDLLPVLAEHGAPIERPAFLGWSMGGYGALLLGSTLGPQKCRGIAGMSNALWHKAAQTAPGAYDDASDFGEHNIFTRVDVLRTMNVSISCGFDDPFIATNKDLAGELPNARADISAGGHDGAFWTPAGTAAIAWLADLP